MSQKNQKKIAILIESDFYENEIFYYKYRFAEEDFELHFLSRLWGQERLTFYGHEYKAPMDCWESFENMSDEELKTYSAIIIPSGMVADRLRYTEDINKLPPAVEFMKRAFAQKNIIKGIICHGLWLLAPATELVKGRKLVCHNNLLGDAKAYGAVYVNNDVVVDNDLITARAGDYAHLLAKEIIKQLNK
jgi:protease I